MPHVFYSAALARVHQAIWETKAYRDSMGTRERKFYTVAGEEVEGNLESASAELSERMAAKYPDAEYRGEGVLTRTQGMA